MSASQLFRVGAVLLVIGGILGLLGGLLSPPGADPRQQIASPLFLPSNWLLLLGGLLAVLGLPAAYAVIAQRGGAIGLLGFLGVMLAGMLFPVSLSVLTLLIIPWIVTLPIPAAAVAQGPPPGFGIYLPIAGVIALVGAVLFGIAIIRAGVFSRWPGYLLIIAGIVNIITSLPFPSPLQEGGILGSIGGDLFNITLGWIGYKLWQVAAGGASEPTWLRKLAG